MKPSWDRRRPEPTWHEKLGKVVVDGRIVLYAFGLIVYPSLLGLQALVAWLRGLR